MKALVIMGSLLAVLFVMQAPFDLVLSFVGGIIGSLIVNWVGRKYQ